MIAANIIGALLGVSLVIGLYMLPTIIALSRKVPNTMSIGVVNLFLGWTLIGWVVALAWSVKTVQKQPAPWEQGAPVFPPTGPPDQPSKP